MRNKSRLMDILDRAYNGPPCDERDFDMKYVARGVSKVVKDHNLKLDKSKIVQQDDDLADRLWAAALDFLESCGVYNTSTSRRMTFSRREIEEFLKHTPIEVTIGEGADARREVRRGLADPRPPLIIGGPVGTPLSEDLYVPIMQSYIQEPIVDTVTTGTLETTMGREPRTRSPLEVVAAWEEVELLFSAARRAGRPGMGFGAVQMAISEIGHLTAINRGGGYRPTDWQMIAMISEMKTNSDLLIKVAHTVMTNGVMHSFYNPILGGYGGGEEGLAVLITAGITAMQLIYMATTHCTAPVSPGISADTLPQILRAVSTALTALTRNAPLMVDVMTSPVAGPGTEMLLYETLAISTMATACGATRLMGPRSAAGIHVNHCTGLESRFKGEVGHAAAGLSRAQADEIVRQAVAQYEPYLNDKPIGQPFNKLYDVATVRPTAEWLDIYEQVKEQAAAWGLTFK